MAWQMALGAGAGALGGLLGGMAQQDAARSARNQIGQAQGYLDREYATLAQQQQDLQRPWMQGGQQAFGDLSRFRMREASPYQAGSFGGVNMAEDPGVAYRMQQGQNALTADLAKRGASLGGMAQKALQENAQNLASQEFQNAYQRQYGQFSDLENARRAQANTEAERMMNYDQYRMNQLQGMAQMGQGATSQLGSSLQGLGENRMAQQMNLQGQLADANATIAGGNKMLFANMLGSAGTGLTNWGSYAMGNKNPTPTKPEV